MYKPIYYSQENPLWAKLLYSNHSDPKQTIGTSACGTTCFAMAASSLLGRSVLPPETAKYSLDHGFRTDNNGTAWDFFESAAKDYGLTCKRTGSLEEVMLELGDGAFGIAAMGPGHTTGAGHYISLVGINGKMIDVFDPNQDNTKYGTDGLIEQGVRNDGKVKIHEIVFRKEAKQYWIFTSTKNEEDQPMTKEEKQAFDALREDVAALKIAIAGANKKVEAPAWFVKEFGSADLGVKIVDPRFTEEGWRVLAVGLRAKHD